MVESGLRGLNCCPAALLRPAGSSPLNRRHISVMSSNRCRPSHMDLVPGWPSLLRPKKPPSWRSSMRQPLFPGGRTKQLSLSPDQIPLVRQWLRNYRQLKANLERICELNHHLLRPEKKP